MRRLLVTANLIPGSPILVSLMMEALHYSETPVLTRATWRNIPEDVIPHTFVSYVQGLLINNAILDIRFSHNLKNEFQQLLKCVMHNCTLPIVSCSEC
jgi:hypothetical protein